MILLPFAIAAICLFLLLLFTAQTLIFVFFGVALCALIVYKLWPTSTPEETARKRQIILAAMGLIMAVSAHFAWEQAKSSLFGDDAERDTLQFEMRKNSSPSDIDKRFAIAYVGINQVSM